VNSCTIFALKSPHQVTVAGVALFADYVSLRKNYEEKAVRIFGDLLLAVGFIFLILFVLAAFGGGGIGWVPFLVSGMLIATGANLRKSGRGLLREKPAQADAKANAAAAATGQTSSAAPEFSIVEMPMTADVAAAIMGQAAHYWRNVKRVVTFFFIFFVVLGVVLDYGVSDVTPRHAFLVIFPLIGLASVVMIGGISWLTIQRPARRDLKSATYLRSTGPLEIVDISGGAILRLADRSFLVNGTAGAPELSNLNWGRVDYSPHGHVILAAWDRNGRSVYCLSGYKLGTATA
jgi:hypothetical protein